MSIRKACLKQLFTISITLSIFSIVCLTGCDSAGSANSQAAEPQIAETNPRPNAESGQNKSISHLYLTINDPATNAGRRPLEYQPIDVEFGWYDADRSEPVFVLDANRVRLTRKVTVNSTCGGESTLFDNTETYDFFFEPGEIDTTYTGGFTFYDDCDYIVEFYYKEEQRAPWEPWTFINERTETRRVESLPPAVVINGARTINSGDTITWTADVNFGSGSTSYQWYYKLPGGTSWNTGGTSSSYTRTFTNTSSAIRDAAVRVDVSRLGQTKRSDLPISVSPSCSPNVLLCPASN